MSLKYESVSEEVGDGVDAREGGLALDVCSFSYMRIYSVICDSG